METVDGQSLLGNLAEGTDVSIANNWRFNSVAMEVLALKFEAKQLFQEKVHTGTDSLSDSNYTITARREATGGDGGMVGHRMV